MQFPVLLISKDKSLEIIDSEIYFKKATRYTVKKNGYVGCLVIDLEDRCFLIESISAQPGKKAFKLLNLFNPMMDIDLKFKDIYLSQDEKMEVIVSAIMASSQFWEDFESMEVIGRNLRNMKSTGSVIGYLKSIRNV